MATKKCPVCGVSVKLENLERHVKNQHPRETVDVPSILSQEERKQADRARAAARPTVTRKGLQRIGIIAVVVAVLLAVVILNPFRGVGPQVGQVAPDFNLETSTTGTISLSSYRGSPVLLEFMDVDCGACQADAPILVSVFNSFSGRGVRFLTVSLINFVPPADTKETVEGFRTQYGTNWVYAMDFSGSTQQTYLVDRTPTTFILDRNGVIVAKFVGRPTDGSTGYANALEQALKV